MEVIKIKNYSEKRCCGKKYIRNQKYKEPYNTHDHRKKDNKCSCQHVIVNCCPNDNAPNNNQCTCRGTLNVDLGGTSGTFMANICPNCSLSGSNVMATVPENGGGFSFTSNFVFQPVCHTNSVGTVLDTGGTGILTVDGVNTFPATFTLNLLETNVGDDLFIFTVSGFDNTGTPFVSITTTQVPDATLTVLSCNNSPLSLNSTSNVPVQFIQGETKDKTIIYANGRVIEKDLS